MPTQNILVILHCRALTLGLQSPEPTRFASFSRNLPWPNGKFVASHSEYAYFGTSRCFYILVAKNGSAQETESIPLTEYCPIFRVPEYSELPICVGIGSYEFRSVGCAARNIPVYQFDPGGRRVG